MSIWRLLKIPTLSWLAEILELRKGLREGGFERHSPQCTKYQIFVIQYKIFFFRPMDDSDLQKLIYNHLELQEEEYENQD